MEVQTQAQSTQWCPKICFHFGSQLMVVVPGRKIWQLWLLPEVWTVSCNQFPQGQQGPKPAYCSGVAAGGASFIWSSDQTHRIVAVPQDTLPVSSGWSIFPSWLFHFDVLLCTQTSWPPITVRPCTEVRILANSIAAHLKYRVEGHKRGFYFFFNC